MYLLLRIIGVWFLLLAMVAAVIDATKSLAAGGAWVVTSLGHQWSSLNPDSLAAAKTAVETHVGTFIWNPMITEILNAPTWVVFGVLGVVLYLAWAEARPGRSFHQLELKPGRAGQGGSSMFTLKRKPLSMPTRGGAARPRRSHSDRGEAFSSMERRSRAHTRRAPG